MNDVDIYKRLMVLYKNEAVQIGMHNLLTKRKTHGDYFEGVIEELEYPIDLRMLEVCLKQQTHLNLLSGYVP